MLSLNKNFLYIHAPKTGGTSIKSILKNYETNIFNKNSQSIYFEELKEKNWNDLQKEKNYNIKEKVNDSYHYASYHWKNLLDNNIYNTINKFGTIRNPYDRIISIHMWYNNNIFDKKILIDKINKHAYEKFTPWNPCSFYYGTFIKNNEQLVYNSDVDFFLRFENIFNQDNMLKLCRKLNIEMSGLVHLNKNKREDKHYSEYYDEELYDLVTKVYSFDLQLFKYEFGEK